MKKAIRWTVIALFLAGILILRQITGFITVHEKDQAVFQEYD